MNRKSFISCILACTMTVLPLPRGSGVCPGGGGCKPLQAGIRPPWVPPLRGVQDQEHQGAEQVLWKHPRSLHSPRQTPSGPLGPQLHVPDPHLSHQLNWTACSKPTARDKPPVATSDPNSVYLIPTYAPVKLDSMQQASGERSESVDSRQHGAMRGCFSCTDWDVL